jgi:hypothetical protein
MAAGAFGATSDPKDVPAARATATPIFRRRETLSQDVVVGLMGLSIMRE